MTVANIGPQGIRRRRLVGVVAGVAGVVVVGVLALSPASPLWRVTAFPLFWIGAVGWLQAREKT